MYGDLHGKTSTANFLSQLSAINKEKWFVEFKTNVAEVTDLRGSTLSEISKPEGETERKRGRPRKIVVKLSENQSKCNSEPEVVNLSLLPTIEENLVIAILSEVENLSPESDVRINADETYFALLAKINSNSIDYKSNMNTKERAHWQEAMDEEIGAMHKNEVGKLLTDLA